MPRLIIFHLAILAPLVYHCALFTKVLVEKPFDPAVLHSLNTDDAIAIRVENSVIFFGVRLFKHSRIAIFGLLGTLMAIICLGCLLFKGSYIEFQHIEENHQSVGTMIFEDDGSKIEVRPDGTTRRIE